MLRWQKSPTAKFQAFVTAALRATLAAAEPGWLKQYPGLTRVFDERQTETAVSALLEAHDSRDVYQATDYHWLLLWEILHAYYEAERPIPQPVFDRWIDGYFWDADFLMPEAADLGPEGRRMAGVSGEAFGIAVGLAPHPDELRLQKCARCPVCKLAVLDALGEPVAEHGAVTRGGRYVRCQGVGQATVP